LELGIEYKDFMASYINSNSMRECNISEEDFEKILKLLGVTIQHRFIIDKDYDGVKEKNELMQRHGRED